MREYLLWALRSIILFLLLVFSLELWTLGAIADWMGRHHKLVTGTDPGGAKEVVNFATNILTWFAGKGRGLIARYVRNFHPTVWNRFRDYLRPRR